MMESQVPKCRGLQSTWMSAAIFWGLAIQNQYYLCWLICEKHNRENRLNHANLPALQVFPISSSCRIPVLSIPSSSAAGNRAVCWMSNNQQEIANYFPLTQTSLCPGGFL